MLSTEQIWRQVPPEEKFELMAQANSTGVLALCSVILIFATFAVGLQVQWLLWVGIAISPLAFQFAAGRAWRDLQPKLMMRYLAARSVARRFGYAAKSKDLSIQLLFRGYVTEETTGDQGVFEAFADIERAASMSEQWIALMNGAVVAFHEGISGGEITFVSLIDELLEVEGKNSDGSEAEYSKNREVYLIQKSSSGAKVRRNKITSKYPGALVVFEKKLIALKEIARQQKIAQENAAREREERIGY